MRTPWLVLALAALLVGAFDDGGCEPVAEGPTMSSSLLQLATATERQSPATAAAPPVAAAPKPAMTDSSVPSCVFAGDRSQWPSELPGVGQAALSYSMVSAPRMQNAIDLASQAIKGGVAGDIVETGCHLGGASMAMTATALALGSDKKVYACDSFAGLPAPSGADAAPEQQAAVAGHPMDPPGSYSFAGGVQTVQQNFEKLLGRCAADRYHLVAGWFNESLPRLSESIKAISVLRLDGDMWSSTVDSLMNLYGKVPAGGYVIIDDYGYWPQCKQAVHDFMECHEGVNITKYLVSIDNTGYYFVKPTAEQAAKTPSRRSDPCPVEVKR